MTSEDKGALTIVCGYSIYELQLKEAASLVVSGIPLTLRPPTPEEIQQGFKPDVVFISGTYKRSVNDRIRSALEVLAAGQLPQGTKDWTTLDGTLRAGSTLGKVVPPLHILPAGLRDCLAEGSRRVHGAVVEAVHFIRWRSGSPRMHRALASVLSLHRWSLNGSEWHPLPGNISGVLIDNSLMPFDTVLREGIEELVRQHVSEPVAHELWREAWALRERGPRSALVIGIAAAEVGFKDLISELVPDARWLAENVPTPPLEKMLREYLPSLKARNTFDGRVLPPHPEALDLLKKAVLERNKATHVGAAVSAERAEQILEMVRDLLWLFDFYRGQTWARDHIRVLPVAPKD